MAIGASGLDLDALGITKTAQQTTSEAKKKANTLDQGDFLKLLTTQLKNQDPLKPVDNEAFVAQMAQFSSVAGISEMNDTLKTMAASLDSGRVSTATSLVGKYVLVPGTKASPDGEGNVYGALDVPAGATNVIVTAKNAAGEVVKTMELGAVDEGLKDFGWEAEGPGPFTISATALVAGESQALKTNVYGLVRSVDLPSAAGGALTLDVIGPGAVDYTNVKKVAG